MSGDVVSISVVLAAKDEQAVLAANLARIVTALGAREGTWEVVCVNDGSQDGTGALMDEAAARDPRIKALHHPRNYGQGRAFRTAFAVCRGEVVVTVDADLSYGPEYIGLLVDALARERVEIALASPYCRGGSVGRVPYYRLFLSRMGNRYLSWTLPYGVATSTCAVRAYRREVLDAVFLACDGMELQLEVLRKAALLGFRVCEVPARLDWPEAKVAEGGLARASKMRILRTIRTYLLMGLFARPALAPGLLGLACALPGVGLGGLLLARWVAALGAPTGSGPVAALGAVLRGAPLLSGLLAFLLLAALACFLAALVLLQLQHQFEELYRAAQAAARRRAGP